jgi:hypothetical protein
MTPMLDAMPDYDRHPVTAGVYYGPEFRGFTTKGCWTRSPDKLLKQTVRAESGGTQFHRCRSTDGGNPSSFAAG